MVGYRGYSDSEGKPNQKGLEKDAEAIVGRAVEIARREGKKLYVFGTSLGGAVGIYVAGLATVTRHLTGLIA